MPWVSAQGFRELIGEEMLPASADRLGGDGDATRRAELATSQIPGMILTRHVLKVEPIASVHPGASPEAASTPSEGSARAREVGGSPQTYRRPHLSGGIVVQTTRRSRPVARTLQSLAVAIGLVSATALLQSPVSATPRHGDETRLMAASHDVLASGVRGIAWYVDSTRDKVVVTVDRSVSKREIASIKRSAGPDASELVFHHASGVFRPLLSGGDAIYGGRYRCSLGFNVTKGGSYYFLTAGHCGKVAKTWYTDAQHRTLIGPTIGYSFPGNDYALVQYTNASLSHPGGFTAAKAYVGEKVTRDGSTSGVHTGVVQALNVTVRYQGGGKVSGMIQTNVCAEPGDSGGPLYDGTKGLGLTSGGSGDCATGGTTFFQPVTEALNAYGVSLY